jgi:hypothetical protein
VLLLIMLMMAEIVEKNAQVLEVAFPIEAILKCESVDYTRLTLLVLLL